MEVLVPLEHRHLAAIVRALGDTAAIPFTGALVADRARASHLSDAEFEALERVRAAYFEAQAGLLG